MMKAGFIPGTLLALALVTAGCTVSPSSTSETSTMTEMFSRGELCDALEAFFTSELNAVDVDSEMVTGSTDQPILAGGSCDVFDGGDRSLYGGVRMRYAPDDPNPIGNMKEHYIETESQGEVVWVFDERASSKYAGSRVTFATTIDGWFGNLTIEEKEIRTVDGAFHLTDSGKLSASSFLVELTRKVAESRSQ